MLETAEIIKVYDGWFTAILSGTVGALGGFFFSLMVMNIERKRTIKHVESSFFNEFYILIGNLEGWLEPLHSEFEESVKDDYTKSAEYDFQYIDTLSLELIKLGKPLTCEQRKFIERIKWKFEAIKRKEDKRETAIQHRDDKKMFIPRHHTAYLLKDCVETIYYLKDFCLKKDRFVIDEKSQSTSKGWALIAYKSAGVQFDDQLWTEVVKFNSPINSL